MKGIHQTLRWKRWHDSCAKTQPKGSEGERIPFSLEKGHHTQKKAKKKKKKKEKGKKRKKEPPPQTGFSALRDVRSLFLKMDTGIRASEKDAKKNGWRHDGYSGEAGVKSLTRIATVLRQKPHSRDQNKKGWGKIEADLKRKGG